MLSDSITQHRLALRTADFDPLPLHDKECHLLGWSGKTAISAAQIRSWQSLTASRNTGILCKHTPALDIDIVNADAADAVEELIRATLDHQKRGARILVRTGLPPKRLIPFRTDKPFSKITIKLIAADGTSEKLEFLGDGQQFVAFGIHPDTMQPYSWRGGEPGTTPRSALPLIDADGALGLINAAANLLVERFGYRRLVSRGSPTRVGHIPSGAPSGLSHDWTQALRQMNPIDWNGDNDGWFKLMTGCKAAGIARRDFIAWSTGDPDYQYDGEVIGRRWDSIGPVIGGKALHEGTLRAALIARGVEPPRQGYGAQRVGHPQWRGVRTINWWARVNSVLNKLQAKRDGDMLFWSACRVAETMADTGKPKPSVAVDLLVSAVSPVIKPDEAKRVVANAFSVVERQILEGDAA
jgi:hypothetical protein